MKTRNALSAAALAAAALLAAGCGTDTCPTETPKIDLIQSCTATPGATVPVRLKACPTCNQNITRCEVDVQGGYIQLDPLAEACDSSTSCPPGCATNDVVCNVTAPSTPGTYTLIVSNGTGGTLQGQLDVAEASGPYACTY
ncbi:hypothetical protein [Anaeromyxobacter sp. PSR-1]|uniref:hypothetical protein n=1 Tax=unclassified Anaeromyxobacter TaxID=2620896 RepID=UPI0005DBA1B8|nr:hypothetical protein [Anaeromyxobacter sp. PSR-1]GAO02250.1 hypothetical protein PSR1_01121 [Anaeromyxobacter sp. PSR-1]